jgi:hypothetical protein
MLSSDAQQRFGLDELTHPFEDLVHIELFVARQLGRTEHAIDQRLQAVGLADDHLGVLAQLRLVEAAFEQLGGAA